MMFFISTVSTCTVCSHCVQSLCPSALCAVTACSHFSYNLDFYRMNALISLWSLFLQDECIDQFVEFAYHPFEGNVT